MSHANTTQQRIETNLRVLQQLKAGQLTTADAQAYTGWGGLKAAVYQSAIHHQLKTLLTPTELSHLKLTLGNAYYTPAWLVDFIYAVLPYFNFTGGRILEPAIGNGIFIERMPDQWRSASQIEAVELDAITGQLTQHLYPELTLSIQPFEQFQPTERYDLIIGNPPYGANKVTDTHHADISHYCIHHYFVAKSMRLLKEGGLLAMVLPAYFLDNETQHVRHIIAREGGHLVAAYRFPDNCFANAKVTIDCVFLRKCATSVAWLKTVPVQIGAYTQPINEYFYQHSHHIFGNLEVIDMYDRKGLTCKGRGEIKTLLHVELNRLKNQAMVYQFRQQHQAELLQRLAEQKALLNTLQAQILALAS